MLDIISKIAEEKIKEAIERGEFDNLPGQGRPLDFSDEFHGPEELRLAYKILKNAGCKPPELEIKEEIVRLEDMLASIKDEQEKYRQIKKLNFLVMKLNMSRKRAVNLEENQRYYGRIVAKVSLAQPAPDAPDRKKT